MADLNTRDPEELTKRYRGLHDEDLVAFIDESYRLAGECRPGEGPFYVMGAVVVTRKDHEDTRADLAEIAQYGKWHTTELNQTERGRQQIQEMLDYMARWPDPCIIAVRHTPGPEDTVHDMRSTCLTALLGALMAPPAQSPQPQPAAMLVFEKQRELKDTHRDLHTIRQARQAGTVPRNLPAHFVSPSIENLLWLPDLVTHTYRRSITHHDTHINQLNDQILTVEVAGKTSDPLAAAAYVQGVSRLFR